MINKQEKCWPPVIAVGLCLLFVSATYPQKTTEEPITIDVLFRALEKKLTDSGAKHLIKRIQERGVAFELSDSDKKKLRNLQRGLGPKRFNELFKVIENNYRPDARKQLTPRIIVAPSAATIPFDPTYPGTDLAGVSGTGVTANVKIMQAYGWTLGGTSLIIKNSSKSGTITNIGFFIKTSSTPEWGGKVDTGPGIYSLTTERWEVETRDFKVVCPFGLMTITAGGVLFKNGNVSSGIPPGHATRFFLKNFNFDIPSQQVERGIIVRFQGIGEDNRADIAVFPKLNLLFPTPSEPFIYQIYRNDKKQ